MPKSLKIPAPTIERLALYSRPLEALQKNGTPLILSEKLAELCGVSPAQVRKDLAYFGEFGIRGVGYDVKALLQEIKHILTTDREWSLCIVGMGNLGRALVENENFRKRGYRFVAVFDSDPEKIGNTLPCGGVPVRPCWLTMSAVYSPSCGNTKTRRLWSSSTTALRTGISVWKKTSLETPYSGMC